MDSSNSNTRWIEGYMAWTNAESWTFGSDRHAHHVLAEARLADSHPDGIDVYEGGMDMLWDAFMVAAHTDSDCTPLLRRMIAATNATNAARPIALAA